MKYFFILLLLFSLIVEAEELKIEAKKFSADQSKGISNFDGDVKVVKGGDELNASSVTIFTDKKNKPTKFVASGAVSFVITTKEGSKYIGSANKVIYAPKEQEYKFYDNVHLKQIDDKKEILGDEVILKIKSGRAYAEGIKKEPVTMIFDIPDTNETNQSKEP